MKWFPIMVFITGFIMLLGQPASANTLTVGNQQKSWKFRVLLNDTPIGYHQVNIQNEADKQTIHTVASFDVRFLFIPVYSYSHETRETWANDCLVSINSTTDDNGTNYFIKGNPKGDSIELITQDGNTSINECVRTFAYWDIKLLNADRLLNTQTGEYQSVSITDLGTGDLLIDEHKIKARHFRLLCEGMIIDLWYSKDMRWLALESETESGDLLRYLPDAPIEKILERRT